MQVFFQTTQKPTISNLQFTGKTETFWKSYNKKLKNVPLKDTVINSIKDSNLLGEGMSKKGYSLQGIKNYVIRIYKKAFNIEDLQKEFIKPEKNNLNTLDNVVLCIPGKIDIVKKKDGESLGVEKFAKRIHVHEDNVLENVEITREETLKSLRLYEEMKNFPISSYKKAYLQIKDFCKKKGFQFDILSPNNILVDTKRKKLNLIDPVEPSINEGVHGKNVDFSEIHGADSLYFTLCDFLLQKEHHNNLTKEEKARWDSAINTIIAKCIAGGENAGYERNLDKMKQLYQNIDKFWGGNKILERFNNFINTHHNSINQEQIFENAVNYKNTVQERIHAINSINTPEFKKVKDVFVELLEAKHQPKVEIPEILNPTLDKIGEYGSIANSLAPNLEKLFDKEIFYPTKKKLYNLFLTIQPENKRFLSEILKSYENKIEKGFFIEEFEILKEKSKKFSKENQKIIETTFENRETNDFDSKLGNRLWMSRTCMTAGPNQEVSVKNMEKAYEYINSVKFDKPKIANLIDLHKITLTGIKSEEFAAGRLRTPDTDELIKQIFNIKKDTKNTVCDYSASKDVVADLEKLEKYIDENFDKMDTFDLAAEIFSETIRIHPFLNGNGRATRLFVEQFLLSKGYVLEKWPEEALYRKICTNEQLSQALRKNCTAK
ncbi:MAG: hypothetical protein E7Z89_03960 [Cyanobacteria bacterium SIG28]|nr:hypothetical protein [Cyanobacteria bacterium SIG28]